MHCPKPMADTTAIYRLWSLCSSTHSDREPAEMMTKYYSRQNDQVYRKSITGSLLRSDSIALCQKCIIC